MLRFAFEKSIEHADRAKVIYDGRGEDDFNSHYPHLLPFYKAGSLKKLDQPIKAALEYQSVMQNLEGQLPAEHPLINTAFTRWLVTRSELEEAGKLEEAEQAGLCECWPFEDYKTKIIPLDRKHPIFPSSFLRGRYSGHVIVLYDVDDAGSPYNLKKITSTNDVLDAAAFEAIESWAFSAKNEGEPAGARLGLTTRVTFQLMDTQGNILPEPPT